LEKHRPTRVVSKGIEELLKKKKVKKKRPKDAKADYIKDDKREHEFAGGVK
jgi:hypothetical protein